MERVSCAGARALPSFQGLTRPGALPEVRPDAMIAATGAIGLPALTSGQAGAGSSLPGSGTRSAGPRLGFTWTCGSSEPAGEARSRGSAGATAAPQCPSMANGSSGRAVQLLPGDRDPSRRLVDLAVHPRSPQELLECPPPEDVHVVETAVAVYEPATPIRHLYPAAIVP